MKKNILFTFLLFCYGLKSQSFLSKTFCSETNYFVVYDSGVMNDGNLILTGTIDGFNKTSADNDYFIAKISDKGILLWIKYFHYNEYINTKITPLSNGSFLLFTIEGLQSDNSCYMMDASGSVVWTKRLPGAQSLDSPSEQAFYTENNQYLSKVAYDGTVLWEKKIEANTGNGIVSSKFCYVGNGKLLYAFDQGINSVGNTSENSIILMLIDMNKGTVVGQKTLRDANGENLRLKTINADNQQVLVAGEVVQKFSPSASTKAKKGFLIQLNPQFSVQKAQTFQGKNPSDNFTVNRVNVLKNNQLYISCSEEVSTPVVKKNFILARLDSKTLLPDLAHYYFDGNNYKHEEMPYLLNNQAQFFQLRDAIFGFNFFKIDDPFLSDYRCEPKKASVLASPLSIEINDNGKADLKTSSTTDKKNWNLVFKTITLKTLDYCPECTCPTLEKKKVTICEGESYPFQKSGKIISLNKTGIYVDTITNVIGCVRFSAVDLKVLPKKQKKLSYFLCDKQPFVSIGSKKYYYPTEAKDTLKTDTGCDSIVTFSIKHIKNLGLSLGKNIEIWEGDKVNLTATNNDPKMVKSYTWLPDNTTICDTCQTITVIPHASKIYTVKANFGICDAVDSTFIKVNKGIASYLPTAFSPNNDQINDIFRPFCSFAIEKIIFFSIYDRWGTMIYEAKDFAPNSPSVFWDGTFRGSNVAKSVYLYRLQTVLKNGEIQNSSGEVTVF